MPIDIKEHFLHMRHTISFSFHHSILDRRDQFGKRTHLHNPAVPGTAYPDGIALIARGIAALFLPHLPTDETAEELPNRSGNTQNCVIVSILNNRILHCSYSL